MYNKFTQKNIYEFLIDVGASESQANLISNMVVVAVGAQNGSDIKEQELKIDGSYRVEISNGRTDVTAVYSSETIGLNFHKHKVDVSSEGDSYTISNLIHTPYSASQTPVGVSKSDVEDAQPVDNTSPEIEDESLPEETPAGIPEEVPVETSVEESEETPAGTVEEAPPAEEVEATADEKEKVEKKKKPKKAASKKKSASKKSK